MAVSAGAVGVPVREFFHSRIANPGYLDVERQIHAGQRMVRIQCGVSFRYRSYCERTGPAGRLKLVAHLDVLLWQFIQRHFDLVFGVVFSISVRSRNLHFFLVTLAQPDQLGFKPRNDLASSLHEHQRLAPFGRIEDLPGGIR